MREVKLKRLEHNIQEQLNNMLKPKCIVSINKLDENVLCMDLSRSKGDR